ncbi:hypothetical protein GUITHDRAFT_115058 [Guillardia theta CCMP2712]|uniref:SET domain-containing protein n=1 Tax=Guillardia theta (strain CCMP2712) TaxID=905079 RepID=L1IR41_GUITC|nr:hypothetical protein GUITHDRAFT_115058 [Guillardia theta CCMP2712]EKX38728.1 hypothetical protein GUITHDRAFT_115058 [Guillardia theta CCMP2712]|eukprot:XP_005825708.1 hypothetical protein GUITHDRAFT_115058 [Guillardia theta CCMP2712]
MVKFLLIFDINCHGEFLYDLSTRLAHSCEPNTFCRSQGDDLQYVATRRIEEGEMLTFSYIGGGPIMVASTRMRRRRLLRLGFFCYCQRCRRPDSMRRLRCPKCSGSECMPEHSIVNFEEIEKKGREGTRVKPRVETSWRCHAEGCDFELEHPDEDKLPLSQEEELEETVFEECCRDPVEFRSQLDGPQLWKLGQVCEAELGPMHWTNAAVDPSKQCLPSPEQILSITRTMIAWFREQMPNSLEEAKMMPIAAQIFSGFGLKEEAAAAMAPSIPLLHVMHHSNVKACERCVIESGSEELLKIARLSVDE